MKVSLQFEVGYTMMRQRAVTMVQNAMVVNSTGNKSLEVHKLLTELWRAINDVTIDDLLQPKEAEDSEESETEEELDSHV